jgi:sec-independent protein translocase protein TatB
MFGLGFMEILLIAIIAIIALGPDKLPDTMVQIAKFIRKFKIGLDDAKSTLNNELNVSEMKAEASKFKSQIEETKSSLSLESKIDLGLNDILNDNLNPSTEQNKQKEPVVKEEIIINEEKKEKVSFKKEDKFKVKFDEKKEDNA